MLMDVSSQPAVDLMTDDIVHYVADFLSPSDLMAAVCVSLLLSAPLAPLTDVLAVLLPLWLSTAK